MSRTTDRHPFVQPWLWLWASPASLLGLGVALISVPFGTRLRRESGAIECHGGPIPWILNHLPVRAMAVTLGHVIWGQSEAALELARGHEHVHVRQYEQWGPLFIPAYLASSLWQMLRGKDAYRDNPFEREAFEHDRQRGA